MKCINNKPGQKQHGLLLLAGCLLVSAQAMSQVVKHNEIPADVAGEMARHEREDVLDNLETKNYPTRYHKPVVLETEKTLETRLDAEQWHNAEKTCAAELSIGYLQFNTKARVEAGIETPDCAASGGEYTLHFDVYDFSNGMKSQELVETWGRTDAEPYSSQTFYEIGENVELIKVYARGLTCTCAAAGDAD